ncbi:MAG: hypothetical protein BWK80_24030, partial [Desulfobacteraceae bacterium IS3]
MAFTDFSKPGRTTRKPTHLKKIAEGDKKMNAVRIKQTVTQEGIIIPLNKIMKFKGKKVEIIIMPDSDAEIPKMNKSKSLKKNLSDLFEEYKDVKAFKNTDPLK